MTEYKDRSFWANASWPRGGAQLVATDLWREGNVCHYPGRAASFGELSLDALRSALRGWWDWHVNGRGWSDIGYQTAMDQRGHVVDLRGLGRVPAAHASPSNPGANWHGGATLFVIGNTEAPSDALIEAYRHYRHEVWLRRWPTATGVTHHRDVRGTSTSCAGDHVDRLVRDRILIQPPQEDEMPLSNADLSKIDALIEKRLTQKRGEFGFGSTVSTSVASNGARYSWGGLKATNRVEAKIDAVLEGIEAMPGVDGDALAAKVAAAVERLDAEAVAAELEVTVKDDEPATAPD